MHMYGQRAAQNGRLWVTFFVTKYRDLFCDQGGGVRAGPPPPGYIHPWTMGKSNEVWLVKTIHQSRNKAASPLYRMVPLRLPGESTEGLLFSEPEINHPMVVPRHSTAPCIMQNTSVSRNVSHGC